MEDVIGKAIDAAGTEVTVCVSGFQRKGRAVSLVSAVGVCSALSRYEHYCTGFLQSPAHRGILVIGNICCRHI